MCIDLTTSSHMPPLMQHQRFEARGVFMQEEGQIMANGAGAEVRTDKEYWWLSPLVLPDIRGSLLIRSLLVFSGVHQVGSEQILVVSFLVWCFASNARMEFCVQ